MRSDARVCPECGSRAGAEPFCSSCGLNLAACERLPTRADWEATHPRPAQDTPEPAAEPRKASAWIRRHRWPVAGALGGLAAVVLVAVLLLGGGSDRSVAGARAFVVAHATAFSNGHWKDYCKQMTPRLQASVTIGDPSQCATQIGVGVTAATKRQVKTWARARTVVSLKGNRATVTWPAHRDWGSQTLLYTGGHWLIDAPAGDYGATYPASFENKFVAAVVDSVNETTGVNDTKAQADCMLFWIESDRRYNPGDPTTSDINSGNVSRDLTAGVMPQWYTDAENGCSGS